MSGREPTGRRIRLGTGIVLLIAACGFGIVGVLAFFVIIGVFGTIGALVGLIIWATMTIALWRGINAPVATRDIDEERPL